MVEYVWPDQKDSSVLGKSHDKLDAMPDVFALVENAAKSLVNLVRAIRSGAYRAPDEGLRNPRQK